MEVMLETPPDPHATSTQLPSLQFNFASWLFRLNQHRPEKVAYIDDIGSTTYDRLESKARRFASVLYTMGVHVEERILLVMLDTAELPVAFLGALYAGVVPVVANTLLTSADYSYMVTHCHARVVIASGAVLSTLAQALADARHDGCRLVVSHPLDADVFSGHALDKLIEAASPMVGPVPSSGDDIAFWLYSSGSTGKPKGTVHTHGNLYWTVELYAKQVLGILEQDVVFSAAKMFFAYGLGNSLTFPLSVGATAILMTGRPTAEAIFERLLSHRPTVFFGVPTLYASMMASAKLPAREQVAMRICTSAGEALPRDTGERFTAHFGCEILDGIGSTEMLHIFLSNRAGEVQYGTTGKPVPGYELELRDETGQAVPDGENGDLYIKGPSAAIMYWRNREKSRATFLGEWTRSGDKYRRLPDGSYVYAGRSDDMLKVSGQYVSPIEVEMVLAQHDAVFEAAVVGIENSGLMKTCAFVVLNAGCLPSEALMEQLKTFVKGRLAPHKYPRQIIFVDDLPKTTTGKIQRFRLREQF